jgi:SAM-dependent methyltransferase
MLGPEMGAIEVIHGGYVHRRRVRILAEHLGRALPRGARVLDVGCGDGLLSRLVQEQGLDLQVRGIDVLVRPDAHVPVEAFDGVHIPSPDKSYDVVMFVDVLHHTNDPTVLLKEARRVARHAIVIKDHTADGLFADATLRFMDHVGNERHGVALPHNYWQHDRWLRAFDELGLAIQLWETDLGLYPVPARWVFDRSLHFVARLGW